MGNYNQPPAYKPLRNAYPSSKADLQNIMPPSAGEIQAALLPRNYSRDHIALQNKIQQRYSNAASIVEQGRIESQRLLMERNARPDSNIVSGEGKPNYYAHYYPGYPRPQQ